MTIMTDPHAALRRELFELVLLNTDTPDTAVDIARDAYDFIVGEMVVVPANDIPQQDVTEPAPGEEELPEEPWTACEECAHMCGGGDDYMECSQDDSRNIYGGGVTFDCPDFDQRTVDKLEMDYHVAAGHASATGDDTLMDSVIAGSFPMVQSRSLAEAEPDPEPEPQPEQQQPEPPPEAIQAAAEEARKRPPVGCGKTIWDDARKETLRTLCEQGLEAKEIEKIMGLKANGAFANAYRFGLTDMWRDARERRRTRQADEASPTKPDVQPAVAPPDGPAADIEVGGKPKVELPSPTASLRPDAGDLAGAALEADRPKPIPTEAEERQRLIEAHIASKGITTTAPDYGLDQPAVDALREAYHSVVRSNDPKCPWLINGGRTSTLLLWKRANAELKARGRKPIKRAE